MKALRIRAYRPGDGPAVVGLWTACRLVVPRNNPQRDIARKLRVNPEWFLVGEAGGRVVATCMVGYEGHRGWINYLAVDPACQRRGYARQIMEEAERLLREAGCPKINLQVRASNQEVIRFYERIGYRVDEVVSMGKRLEADEPSQSRRDDRAIPLGSSDPLGSFSCFFSLVPSGRSRTAG